jgi:PEP-CTERM motif
MKNLLLAGTILAAVGATAAKADFLATSYSVYGAAVQLDAPDAINALAGRVTFSGPQGSVEVWCMDVNDILFVPYNFQISAASPINLPKPGIPNTITLGQLLTIDNLVFSGNDAIDNLGASAGVSAEYQVAIWQTEYGNAFSYTASAGFKNAVDALIDANDNGSPLFNPATVHFSWYSDAVEAPNQTMINQVGSEPFSTPEPSTWAMGIMGFGVLGALAFKRRRNARFALEA